MPDPDDGYLNRRGVMKRYSLSPSALYRLRNHPDPDKRLPEPAMIISDTPMWSLVDLRAFEKRQKELSKTRQTRRPKIVDSSTTVTSRRSRARQGLREHERN